MSNSTTEHIALFVDLENFFGFCNGLGLPIDLAPEMEKLTTIGKVTVRKSFGDIQKLPIPGDKKQEIRKMLQQNLIHHEDIPYHNAFKNSADIRLVIEALSMVYSNDDIDLVAVVGSDRDYLPLFSKVREIGKEVIGIGGSKDNTPDIFVRACDYFFYHENLTGNAAPPESATALLDSGTASETPSGPAAAQGNIADVLTSSSNTEEEAVSLLVEALKVLEAKGGEGVVSAAVIPTMRRLKPDFDLADYGFKNFKQLCERAAENGVITIVHRGTKLDLRLVDHPVSPPEENNADQGQTPAAPTPAHVLLKQWIEDKMKVPLPGHGNRILIYKHLEATLKASPVISLTDLSSLVAEKMKRKDVEQPTVYKILYSLYRGNCFSCSPGTIPFDPIINECRIATEDLNAFDKALIQNSMRLYLREHKQTTIDPEAWSEVFYKSNDYTEFVKDIAQSM